MFDKDMIQELRKDIEGALGVVAAKHNITFTIGTMKYDTDTVKMTINGSDNSTPGKNIHEKDYLKHCYKYGLCEADLGASFMNDSGDMYKVTGAKPRNRKYPILAQRADGKNFKFTPEYVRDMVESYRVKQEEVRRIKNGN